MYLGRIEKLLSAYSPVPMCVINSKGKVTRAGGSIDEVFKYDGIVDADIFVLTGIKLPDIIEAAGKKEPLSLKKERQGVQGNPRHGGRRGNGRHSPLFRGRYLL